MSFYEKYETVIHAAKAFNIVSGDIGIKDIKVDNDNSNDSAASFNLYPISTPIHQELNKYRTWILNSKKLVAAGDSTSPASLLRLSAQLSAKGVPRLPTDLLEQRLTSMNKILPSLDTHMCSALLTEQFNLYEFMVQALSAMESFSDDEATIWFSFNKAAIEAQLDGSSIIVLSTENAAQGINYKISL